MLTDKIRLCKQYLYPTTKINITIFIINTPSLKSLTLWLNSSGKCLAILFRPSSFLAPKALKKIFGFPTL
jgi:hypothetical protein